MRVPTLSRELARRLDQRAQDEFGVAGLVLMENAGRGVADKLIELGADSPVVICCGKGNNAGDGFVIARHLDLRGLQTKVLIWPDEDSLTGDALVNFLILKRSGFAIESMGAVHDATRLSAELGEPAWIVDALLGTGAVGEPRAPLDQVIEQINANSAPTLAIDLPSGFDANTGAAAKHTIRAAHTCTFVAQKPGFLVEGAEQYTGTVHVLDIGAPRALVDEMLSEDVD